MLHQAPLSGWRVLPFDWIENCRLKVHRLTVPAALSGFYSSDLHLIYLQPIKIHCTELGPDVFHVCWMWILNLAIDLDLSRLKKVIWAQLFSVGRCFRVKRFKVVNRRISRTIQFWIPVHKLNNYTIQWGVSEWESEKWYIINKQFSLWSTGNASFAKTQNLANSERKLLASSNIVSKSTSVFTNIWIYITNPLSIQESIVLNCLCKH